MKQVIRHVFFPFMILMFLFILVLFCLLFGWLGLPLGIFFVFCLVCLFSFVMLHFSLWRPKGRYTRPRFHARFRRKKISAMKSFVLQKRKLISHLDPKDVFITSKDGLRLHGIYLPSKNKDETRCVLLAHGYSWQALQMVEYALWWRETYGVNVLMPDARAHGESEGRYIGMGWPERFDIHQWCEWLTSLHGENCKIALHGISMGGATCVLAAGEDPAPQVKLLIEDCCFSNAYEELAFQLSNDFGLPGFPFLPLADIFCSVCAGYRLSDVRVDKKAENIHIPTIIIHGLRDTFVPPHMAKCIYDAVACKEKKLILVEDAEHIEAFWKDPDGDIKSAIKEYMLCHLPL